MVPRFKLSHAPAVLALAVAQASFATTIVVSTGGDYTNSVLVNTPLTTVPSPYTVTTASVNVNDNFAVQYNSVGIAYLVYYYSAPGATGVVAGPTSALYNYSNALPSDTLISLTSSGGVLGSANRYNGTGTATYGKDEWLFLPGVSTPGSPTIIGDQGILDVTGASANGSIYYTNGPGGSTPYFRTIGSVASNGAVAFNASNQVIGVATRGYGASETTATTALGQDAFIYSPATNTPTIISLTAAANTYSTTVGGFTNSVVYNNVDAINDVGTVIGYANRFNAYSTTPSSTAAGVDAWIYSASGSTVPSGGTLEIGLTGNATPATLAGYYSVNVTLNTSGTPTTYTLQSTSPYGISSSAAGSQVAGTSVVYGVKTASSSSTTAPTISNLGQEAWIFTPTIAAGASIATASGYGTSAVGTYTQVGLLTSSNPNIAYVNPTSQARTSTFTAFNAAGDAAGTSLRYDAVLGTSLGQDAWFYSPATGTVLITPSSSTYSNYTSATGGVTATQILLNSVNNANTIAAGTINRTYVSGGTNTGVGSDVFAYSPADGNTYVIASPAIIATFPQFHNYASDAGTSEGFIGAIKGVTDSGMVYGYFNAQVGPSANSQSIGTYIFVWTKATGTLLLSSESTSAGVGSAIPASYVDALNSTQWNDLLNGGVSVFADSSGNLFGFGLENSGQYGIFELALPTGLANASGTWTNGAGDGKWATNVASGSNWTGGLPNGVGQIATFDDTAVGGPGTVDLNANKTIGGLVFNTASAGYTIGLPGTTNVLTLQTFTGDATITVTGAASHTINAPVALATATDISVAGGASLTVAGAISGAPALTMAGGGTLVLSGSNTFTGTTTINGGTIRATANNALGYGGPVTTVNPLTASGSSAASILDLAGSITVNKPIALNGSTNGASLINSIAGTTSVLSNGVAGVSITTAPTGITGGATLTFGSGAATATAQLGVTAQSFTVSSSTETYSYAPYVTITGGGGSGATANATLNGSGVVTGITITNPGTGFTSAPTITFAGGNFIVSGTTPFGTGNNTHFTLVSTSMTSPGSGYTASPSVTLSSGTGGSIASVLPVLTLTGTNNSIGGDGNLTINAPVYGTGGGFTKIGGGTVTLTAANTYDSGTTVSSGTLIVSNTTGSATGSGSVTINGGTLGGTGSISGNVIAGSEAHTIAPSAGLSPTSITNLTVGGLTTNSNTTLSFNLNGAGVNDTITTGALTLNGGSIVVANTPTGASSLGYYKLIAYTGSILGTGVSSLTVPTSPAGPSVVYQISTTQNPGYIDLHRGFLGDANDDGVVNFSDFVALSNHFGLSGAGWTGGDFNGDGIVNFSDFVILSNNFGNSIPGSSESVSASEVAAFDSAASSFFGTSSVPEPTSLALMGLGAVALLKRRRKA